jgi:transposase-like protein
MTFLNDLWKKFKSPVTPNKEEGTGGVEGVLETHQASNPTKALKQTAEAFQKAEEEYLRKDQLLDNLKALKELLDQPKEEAPEFRFTKINQHLGDLECHETVRRDRWGNKITCPSCQSANLVRLAQLPNKSPLNHRYRCLTCGTEFNDDSGTPIEKGVPPINIWMQCWYLMGCTDSLSYIATKLNMDLAIVESMVLQLKKIFNAQKPLTHFLEFEEWNNQAQELRNQLKEDLLKQYEVLDANVSTAPKDTTEFRRQQNLRRTLNSSTSTDPTNPTPRGKKRF